MNQQARFIVITTAKVKPESIEAVVKLFAETNPALVENQVDWLDAKFTVNREANEITVMAFWKKDESYLQFSSGATFQNTMKRFAPHFIAPPKVQINEILVDMSHDRVWQP